MPDVSTRILINIEDEAHEFAEHPMFTFQRSIGENILLLPDLDTILLEFYEHPFYALPDTLPFINKQDSAIFAGSTTGGGNIGRNELEAPFPRLRAARFFRNHPQVQFLLPAIVQTESAEIEAALRNEGFGTDPVSWPEQFKHKILLSIDGNGATLSRVHIALASNCALVKYSSNNEAWYFQGLVSGKHFLEIKEDADLIEIIEHKMADLNIVASNGQEFSKRFLSKSTYKSYTADLIRAYANRMSQ